MRRIALTVDVEPDWGVRGTRAFREVTPRFLDFLDRRGVRATFFVVSDLMEVDAGLVEALSERHEIASHGCTHRPLDRLGAEEVGDELRTSRECLEQTGQRVEGFRAPFFRRTRRWLEQVRAAGYRYDASMGSVLPGPANFRLGRLPCPHGRGGIPEFPTSSMWCGMLPFSLTYLRLCYPASLWHLPRGASLLYLHLHEFLPPETASVLPARLRGLLRRNCGEQAWEILSRTLDEMGAEFVSCRDMLASAGCEHKKNIEERPYEP